MDNQTCLPLPLPMNSAGVWEFSNNPFLYILRIFLFQIVLILCTCQFLTFILKCCRIHLSEFATQMIIGILFSPTFLGKVELFKWYLLKAELQIQTLKTISFFGYSLFLFLVGSEVDLKILTRKFSLIVGVISLCTPYFSNIIFQYFLIKYGYISEVDNVYFIHVAHTFSLTTVPVLYSLLNEFKLVHTNFGQFGLSVALVCDLVNSLLTNISNVFDSVKKDESLSPAIQHILFVFFFFIVSFGVFRPAMTWLVRRTPRGSSMSRFLYNVVFILILLAEYKFSGFNQFVFSGPFILGLSLPHDAFLQLEFSENLNFMVSRVLLPVFVVNCTMSVDYLDFPNGAGHLYMVTIVVLSTVGLKFVSTIIPLFWMKVQIHSAMLLGLLVCCKGIIELATMANLKADQVRLTIGKMKRM